MKHSIVTKYEDENWRDIRGYEGLYQISSLGRVCSLQQPRIMSPTDNGNGYLYISLHKDKKRKNFYVHRLVAESFIPNPDNKAQVNHLDHNRKNNAVENLEWVSCAENINYSAHLLRAPRRNGKRTNKEFGTGIRVKKGKYEVYICHKYLGRYWELVDAQKVRDEYVKEYYHEI